jgi:hypothetical protein
MKIRKGSQREFGFVKWGGKRRGAGRKPKGDRAGVSHERRAKHAARNPLLVTLKIRRGLPRLRYAAVHGVVRAALAAGTKADFRVVEHSLQNDHIHLIVEAEDERSLSRWMKGVAVRLARALNRIWKRMGNVFPDRYHARSLTSPRAVRTALVYVLGNARKHGVWSGPGPDAYSSGPSFEGWKGAKCLQLSADSSRGLPERARTWLLSIGWRRHGLLDPRECPLVPQRRA